MQQYLCPIDLDFTTLTTGTVYYSLFNTYTHNMGINKISLQTMSATGSGNTKCMYAFARASGTIPTGGTVISYTKMDTSNTTVSLDIRKADAGLTVTSTVIDPYFFEVAIRTGSDGQQIEHTFDNDNGLIIAPGQGIVILADGAGIAGASLHGSIEFNLNP